MKATIKALFVDGIRERSFHVSVLVAGGGAYRATGAH